MRSRVQQLRCAARRGPANAGAGAAAGTGCPPRCGVGRRAWCGAQARRHDAPAGPFWQAEYALAQAPGVLRSAVGFANGGAAEPEFDDVVAGLTKHAFAVQVLYDSSLSDFRDLLEAFWQHLQSPAVEDAPVTPQLRAAVYCHTGDQQAVAEDFLVRGAVPVITPHRVHARAHATRRLRSRRAWRNCITALAAARPIFRRGTLPAVWQRLLASSVLLQQQSAACRSSREFEAEGAPPDCTPCAVQAEKKKTVELERGLQVDVEPLTDFSMAEPFHQQYIADGGDINLFEPPEPQPDPEAEAEGEDDHGPESEQSGSGGGQNNDAGAML